MAHILYECFGIKSVVFQNLPHRIFQSHFLDSFLIVVISFFQVITGGNNDVDVILKGPLGEELYKVEKKQYDNHEITPATSGTYQLCFSNEFSTFTHKVVYFEWQNGPEKTITSSNPTALTQVGLIPLHCVGGKDRVCHFVSS